MPDVKSILRRQTQWQNERRELSWAAKIRQAEQVREGIQAIRNSRKQHG
ncbi:MAG: hypothetical protein HQ523_02760 [Lentisphaerae bacterium]|nr:hypothetical protein [Lentisphaerota bacterium]